MATIRPIKLFYSYSHKDETLREKIEEHLVILRRQGFVEEWHDRRISAGSEWKDQISGHLKRADVILILVSSSFLASDYCYDIEMKEALARHSAQQARVIPVILRDCLWSEAPFAKLQALPRGGQHIASWTHEDEALTDVAKGIRDVAVELGKRQPSKTELASEGKVWNVPYRRNPFFTGREETLKEIRQAFELRKKAVLGQAIRGLGGIGKTQTAIEYAYRYANDYDEVFWIDAATETGLASGFADIARVLNLPQSASDPRVSQNAVKHWLATNRDWLVVFDNADAPELLEPYIPREVGGHVLVTSRARDFTQLGITDPLPLQTMSPRDGKAFLLKRIRSRERDEFDQADEKAAELLVTDLGGLPLAIEQAGAYIRKTSSRIDDYLQSYHIRRLELFRDRTSAEDQRLSVGTTWSLNFSELDSRPASKDLLYFSAFVSPEAIPFELVSDGARELGNAISKQLETVADDPLLLMEILEPLSEYSLIELDTSARTYSIHRVVQEVLRESLNLEGRQLWVERTVKALFAAFPDVSYRNWQQCQRLISHALRVAELASELGLSCLEFAVVASKAAAYSKDCGQYVVAEPLYRQAMEIRRSARGEDHPDFASSLNDLAGLYDAMGRYTEAEPLYHQATEICRSALGESHPDFGANLNDLAGLYAATGRYEEAEPLYQQASEICRSALGDGHPNFATSLNDLAGLYDLMGRYEEAEPLYQQAIEIFRDALGEDHPDFGASLNNLAGLYASMGRYWKAEQLCQQAIEIRRTVTGEDHPHFAASLNDLAGLYRSMGRYEDAEPLYRQAAEILRSALGEHHPHLAASQNNLALLFRLMGRYEEAVPLFRRACEICRTTLGEGHPDFATSLNNLAGLYRAMGRYEKAEQLHRQAIEIYRGALGEDHPHFATGLHNLAELLREMGHYKEAEPLYCHAAEIRRTALGEDHPEFAASLNMCRAMGSANQDSTNHKG